MSVRGRVNSTDFIGRQMSYGSDLAPPARVISPSLAQVTYSDGHAFQLLGKTGSDIGGSFQSSKIEISHGGQSYPQWMRYPGYMPGLYAYEYFTHPVASGDVAAVVSGINQQGGSQTLLDTHMGIACPLGFNISNLTALGAKAIDNFAPTNPVADLSTTLAEFFSEKRFFAIPGSAGSLPGEYLNVMFGVLPTVSFAKDLRTAIREKEKIVAQLARDSGKGVRRSGAVFSDSSHNVTTQTGVYPAFIGPGTTTQLVSQGTLTTTTTTDRRAWFSGSFTYFLPKEGLMRTIDELDKKYGVKVGVDTAWELLPFSWLVDYATSAGSAIGNISKFGADGLVMSYGYMMGESITTTNYDWNGYYHYNSGGNYTNGFALSSAVVKTTKQRVPASPFGFGILPGGLSDRQLSIIAALGLSYLK